MAAVHVTRRVRTLAAVAALTLAVASCSTGGSESDADAETVGSSQSPTSSASLPTSSVVPLGDEAELAQILGTVGLEVDRAVALPGTDDVAFVVVAPGASAIDAWRSARSLLEATGRHPVIVGGPVEYGGGISTDFEQILQSAEFLAEDGVTVGSVLADAENVDLGAWFDARVAYLVVDESELDAASPLPDYPWAKDRFLTTSDILTEEPLPFVEIALLPTPHSWEAPAYLLWGGWNDVPNPHELAAILRHWWQVYGGEVVAMTGAVVEMTVAEPPATDDDAIALAREHFLVAPDNVWQGTGDLDLLAAAVLDAPVWYFWWD